MNEESIQSKGGHARAQALTAQERSDAARRAASARWHGDIPQATHEGELCVGRAKIRAAVLPDGRRVLHETGFLAAIGRSRRSGKLGSAVIEGMPPFLAAEQIKPFVSQDLLRSTTPVYFRTARGNRAIGYQAELLPMVCEVYLRFRDDSLEKHGKVPGQYAHVFRACDILIRGLAQVGIVALVDEATGYQEIRDRQALREILDQYLAKERAAWAKRFPEDFYKEMFRLRGWQWKGMSVNRPQCVGQYTNDLVYERLASGILKELEERNPKDGRGNRKSKHHQWLSSEVGHPRLSEHVHAVIGFMRASDDWGGFKRLVDRAFPRKGNALAI